MRRELDIIFDLQKATHLSSADGALICLHSHYLTAVNTQAHVSTGEHNRVFCRSVAHNALLLGVVHQIGGRVINFIDVVEVLIIE